MDNKVYDGKIELQYKREVVTFLGRVADVSSPDSYKYESSCRLTHPGSNLDFQYSGVLINNADISSWSMATKYLLSKTQEYITSSLRAELDKTRNEAILEVNVYVNREIILINSKHEQSILLITNISSRYFQNIK